MRFLPARSVEASGPALVAVRVGRGPEHALDKTGWWDAPSPPNHPEQHERWLAGRAEEQQQ